MMEETFFSSSPFRLPEDFRPRLGERAPTDSRVGLQQLGTSFGGEALLRPRYQGQRRGQQQRSRGRFRRLRTGPLTLQVRRGE